MAVYECTKNVTGKNGRARHVKGERVHTVDGSVHDKRLAGSDAFKPVDEDAKKATEQAKADA